MYLSFVTAWNKENNHMCQWIGGIRKMLELFRTAPLEGEELINLYGSDLAANGAIIFPIFRFPKQFIFAIDDGFDISQFCEPIFK